jgi:hypothetical protein
VRDSVCMTTPKRNVDDVLLDDEASRRLAVFSPLENCGPAQCCDFDRFFFFFFFVSPLLIDHSIAGRVAVWLGEPSPATAPGWGAAMSSQSSIGWYEQQIASRAIFSSTTPRAGGWCVWVGGCAFLMSKAGGLRASSTFATRTHTNAGGDDVAWVELNDTRTCLSQCFHVAKLWPGVIERVGLRCEWVCMQSHCPHSRQFRPSGKSCIFLSSPASTSQPPSTTAVAHHYLAVRSPLHSQSSPVSLSSSSSSSSSSSITDEHITATTTTMISTVTSPSSQTQSHATPPFIPQPSRFAIHFVHCTHGSSGDRLHSRAHRQTPPADVQ